MCALYVTQRPFSAWPLTAMCLAAWMICICGGCATDSAERTAVDDYADFLKVHCPPMGVTGIPELGSEWRNLAERVAALGAGVASDLADLYVEALSDEDLGQVWRGAFFVPLWQLPGPELRQAGLLLVRRPEAFTRLNGLWALALCHAKEDLPIVSELTGSDDREVREYAAYCLGFWGPEANDELIALTHSTEPIVRLQACIALLNAGADRFAERLAEMAKGDDLALVRVLALEALAGIGDDKAARRLLEFIWWKDPESDLLTGETQRMAIEALMRLDAYQEWRAVAKAMDSPNKTVAAAAARYLLECPFDQAKEHAEERVREDEDLRRSLDLIDGPQALRKVPREKGHGYFIYRGPPR